MCSAWGKYAPQLYELLQKLISIFEEYPVENTHRILWAETNSYMTLLNSRGKRTSLFLNPKRGNCISGLFLHHQENSLFPKTS